MFSCEEKGLEEVEKYSTVETSARWFWCGSNTYCQDETWCYCYGQQNSQPCNAPIETDCQYSEAISDFYLYSNWPQPIGGCTPVYVSASDCGLQNCSVFSNYTHFFYTGYHTSYPEICNDMTNTINALIECYMGGINSLEECPTCGQVSYVPDISYYSFGCDNTITFNGLWIYCCN